MYYAKFSNFLYNKNYCLKIFITSLNKLSENMTI
jgi:hypothetical protein